jgi:hypothetical protein
MLEEQRFEIVEGAGELLVFQCGECWQVWLNKKQDFDGVLVASGIDHAEAMQLAIEFLLGAVRVLRNVIDGAAPPEPPDCGSTVGARGG